jgi:hypothetical protein
MATLQRARALLAARRYEDAAALAYQVSAGAPGDPSPLVVAAWAERGRGDLVAAERVAKDAVGLAPTLPEAHRALVAVLTDRTYRGHARRDLPVIAAAEELVRLAPTDVASYWALTDACVAARRVRLAVSTSTTALEMAPHLAQTWLLRARAARAAHDYTVAEAAIREALRLDPDNYAANNELGIILRRRGRSAESIRQLAASVAIDPLARPARKNLLAFGFFPFLLLSMLVTSPTLLVAPRDVAWWAWGCIGLQIWLWGMAPTRRVMERWALPVALWRGQRQGWRPPWRVALVPCTTPIQRYRSNRIVLILLLVNMLWMSVAVTAAVTISPPPAYLALAAPLDAAAILLGVYVLKRLRPRPRVSQ